VRLGVAQLPSAPMTTNVRSDFRISLPSRPIERLAKQTPLLSDKPSPTIVTTSECAAARTMTAHIQGWGHMQHSARWQAEHYRSLGETESLASLRWHLQPLAA